jgi:hypothetical protein
VSELEGHFQKETNRAALHPIPAGFDFSSPEIFDPDNRVSRALLTASTTKGERGASARYHEYIALYSGVALLELALSDPEFGTAEQRLQYISEINLGVFLPRLDFLTLHALEGGDVAKAVTTPAVLSTRSLLSSASLSTFDKLQLVRQKAAVNKAARIPDSNQSDARKDTRKYGNISSRRDAGAALRAPAPPRQDTGSSSPSTQSNSAQPNTRDRSQSRGGRSTSKQH